jgi:hypothetical protein
MISDASIQCKSPDRSAAFNAARTPHFSSLLLVFSHDCVARCEKKATEY